MSGKRRLLLVLLLAVGLAGGFLALLYLTPTPTIPEQPLPPPAVERPKPALQADAEGQYVPGYRFSVGRFRFTGFSLRPEALVTFAQATSRREDAAARLGARISAVNIPLPRKYQPAVIVAIQVRVLRAVRAVLLGTQSLYAA